MHRSAIADVVVDLLVVGRGPDLGRHAALEVGDLLGPLVHQEDHHLALGIVLQDAERHVAQEGRLARAGRGDDQAARALADRAEQVDRAGGHAPVLHLHLQVLVRGDGGERGEVELGAALLEREAVDRLDELHLRVGKAALGREGGAADQHARLQLEAPDQLLRHERVGGPALAVLGEVEQLAVAALGEVDVEDALDTDDVFDGRAARGRRGRRGRRGGGPLGGSGRDCPPGRTLIFFPYWSK